MRRMLPPNHLKKRYEGRMEEPEPEENRLTEYDREAEDNPPSPLPFANGMFGNYWHTQLPSMDEQERRCR